MDLFIKNAIEELKKSSKGYDINEKSKKKIYELFPIPREHKILWADIVVENNILKELNIKCKKCKKQITLGI